MPRQAHWRALLLRTGLISRSRAHCGSPRRIGWKVGLINVSPGRLFPSPPPPRALTSFHPIWRSPQRGWWVVAVGLQRRSGCSPAGPAQPRGGCGCGLLGFSPELALSCTRGPRRTPSRVRVPSLISPFVHSFSFLLFSSRPLAPWWLWRCGGCGGRLAAAHRPPFRHVRQESSRVTV